MTDLGDAARLVDLFEREVDHIFGYLLSRCGSRAVAEDLTSETFAQASRHCAAGRADEVTGAWLQTVAKRRLIDHWRTDGTRRGTVERLGSLLRVDSRHATRTTDAAGGSLDHRVDVALDSLPSRQRAALVLRYMDGFSTAEVADALSLSYKAAESVLSRAREGFRRSYGEQT